MITFTEMTRALSGAGRREADEFAVLVEGHRLPAGHASDALAPLVALTRTLTPADLTPAPDFRAALRTRLVAEAAGRAPSVPAQRAPVPVRPARNTRLRAAVASVAMVSAVSGVGAAAASTQALPGDALYGLKLRIESVQLTLADSDLERGRELLEQADSRLGEAERLAASGTADQPDTRRELAVTLVRMQEATTAGASALTDAYRDTGDQEPMLLLDRFVADQQHRLRDLLGLLDPALRARVMTAADELAVIGGQTGAVLAAATGPARQEAGRPGRARGDGTTLARPGERGALPPSAGTGTGTTTTDTTDTAAAATREAPASSGSGSTPVGAAVDVPTTGAGTSAGTGGVDVGVDVGGPAATALPVVPAPTAAAEPPAPEATAVVVVPVPEPAPVCVVVPPLSSC